MKACPACNSRYGDEVSFCSRDGTAVVVDAAPPADTLVGQVIADRYRLVRKLGEGGMGEVYVAEHVHIEKRVALKLLRAEIVSNPEAVARFKQEARSASSIGHENIVAIDDFGNLPDGRVYLTMEFLEGAPLNDLCKEPMALGRALEILIGTASGLAAAHAKGIVHRDMKPENIYVTRGRDGREVAKILDFGIAKVSGVESNQHLTRTGTIFGTPFYMAPEQALGQALDHRADIYAMGVILYELFAGQVPFKADSFMGILSQHITSEPVPPSAQAAANGRALPPELEAVILHALKKNPAERYQTMGELIEALRDIYRRYVGTGLFQVPLAPPPVPASQFVPVPTGVVAAQPTPVPTPMPAPLSQPMGVPLGMGPPGPGLPSATPMPVQMGPGVVPGMGMGYGPSSYYPVPQEAPRSRGGLIAAIIVIAVLLGGGGVAGWYFLFGPGKQADDQGTVAQGGEAGGGEAGGGEAGGGEAGGGEAGGGEAGGGGQAGGAGPTGGDPAGGGGPTGSDAGVGGGTADGDRAPADAAPAGGDDPGEDLADRADAAPAAPSEIAVLIDSVPRGATIVRAGSLLGTTPTVLNLRAGEPTILTLRKKGYHDATAAWDGAGTKVQEKLDRIRTSGGGHGGGSSGGSSSGGDVELE